MEDVWKKFEKNEITHSAAHHLTAIMDLRKARGYARNADVAKLLNITSGSASINIKSLKQKGLVDEDENKMLLLTPEGERIADAVESRKIICKAFFEQILKVSSEQAEIDACKIEHLISEETANKLEQFTVSRCAVCNTVPILTVPILTVPINTVPIQVVKL